MVASFRSVNLVNTKLRIAGANFLGEAVSEKLTRQQQTSQLPAGILINIKVLLRRDIILGSKRPKDSNNCFNIRCYDSQRHYHLTIISLLRELLPVSYKKALFLNSKFHSLHATVLIAPQFRYCCFLLEHV